MREKHFLNKLGYGLDPANFTSLQRLFSASGIYLVAVAIHLAILLVRTQGQQIYLLDDSYIHAAIARNLVQHHVYGVSPYSTVFASSSVLWPYLVATVFFVIGVHAWVPFVLNVLASLFALWAADKLFGSLIPEPEDPTTRRLRFLALIILIFGAPLLGMTFVGMEHVLHLAAVLLLLNTYVQFERAEAGRDLVVLCFYAALATSLRYETMFLLFPLCVALLWHRKIWASVLTAIAGFIPVVMFGWYALSRGSSFFPGPLSVKTAGNTSFFATALRNFLAISALAGAVTSGFLLGVFLLGFAVYAIRKSQKTSTPGVEVLAIILAAFFLHAGLASFGWFFRYEVYLLGSLTIAFLAIYSGMLANPGTPRPMLRSPILQGALVLFVAIFFVRGVGIAYLSPRNAVAIYEQQYQTGRFIARYYPGHSVALNDIGVPTFMTDFHYLDIWGLASPEVARLGVGNRAGFTAVAANRHVEIGILYPFFFSKIVPANWIFVARFSLANIPGHLFIGAKDVDFYGASPAGAALLAQQIKSFEKDLPNGVRVDLAPRFAGPAAQQQ